MKWTGTLRWRIMAGFSGLLLVAVAGFAVSFAVVTGFQREGAAWRQAIDPVRKASLARNLTFLARAKLSDYFRTATPETGHELMTAVSNLAAKIAETGDEGFNRESGIDTLAALVKATTSGAYETAAKSRALTDNTGQLAGLSLALGDEAAQTGGLGLAATVSRLQVLAGREAVALTQMALAPAVEQQTPIAGLQRQIHEAVSGLSRDAAAAPRLRDLARGLDEHVDSLVAASAVLAAAAARKAKAEQDLDKEIAQTGVVMQKLLSVSRARLDAAVMVSEAASSHLATALIVSGLLVCVIGIFLAALIGDSISRPVTMMQRVITKIAAGDFAVEIPNLRRNDEIGALARAVAVFRENGLRLRETDAAAAAAAAHQQVVVEAIGVGLDQLASGRFSYRLASPFSAGYEKLRLDFNGAMAALESAFSAVAGSTISIRSGAKEMSATSEDLSRRTEQQAANLEETVCVLHQIAEAVRQTAGGSQHARDVAALANAEAARSAEVMRLAIEAMGGIEKSSGAIRQIVGVIDQIAFQTNLLALNAAVEAARAGESGRGFAVVAAEVRALAQRCSQAAAEIRGLIAASSGQVTQGVALVAEAGAALDRIMRQIVDINGVIQTIASSAASQAASLDEVNVAVTSMDRFTQKNAAVAEEASAASHAVTHEIATLAGLITRFGTAGAAKTAGADAKETATIPVPLHSVPLPPGASGSRRSAEERATNGVESAAAQKSLARPEAPARVPGWDHF